MAKPRLLFYLKPDGLEVYSDQTDGAARLDFPLEIVNHQEVFDEEKYSQILENFLTPMGIVGMDTVILVAQPLIFQKEFPHEQSAAAEDPKKLLLDYNALNTKIQEFVEAAPFDNNQISKIELKGEASTLVLITNKSLYQHIVAVETKLQGRVLSVVPVTVFAELAQNQNLDRGAVDVVFSDKKTLQMNNFLLSQSMATPTAKTVTDETSDQEEEGNSGKKQKLLLIFGLIFILGGLVYLAMMLGFVKNPFAQPEQLQISNALVQASPDPNVSVTIATDSATPATSSALLDLKRNLITIGVTNGTGVIGQGGRVENALSALGYETITIDGTAVSGTTDTIVDFKNSISTLVRDEIVKELENIFLIVKSSEATPSAKYDTAITTGVYK